MADSLSTKIDALISGADALSAAADSVATITSGSDVLVSNFDHVEEVFDNLQLFLAELKAGSWYAPVGLISPFAGATAPAGWLLCNGDTVPNGSGTVQSKTSNFAELYSVVGSAYGAAGRLPDLRGRVPLADDASTYLRGASGGGSTTLSTSQLPSHSHTIDHGHGLTSTQGAYMQPGNAAGALQMGNGDGWNIGAAPLPFYVNNHTGSSGSAGSGASVPTVPPYVVTNFIIKF